MEEKAHGKSASTFLETASGKTKSNSIEVPSISLPKGGGALRGIDEKFLVNAVNGTASFSIPLPFSPARGALNKLNLSYSSGLGNGVFGLGWKIDLGSIKRKTEKGLPQYLDSIDSDTFLISGAEDLVPEFKKESDGSFSLDSDGEYIINEKDSTDGLHVIRYYRPRIEGLFARIERWTEKANGIIKWRVTGRDNTSTLYGWNEASRLYDPQDETTIYEWFPEFIFDDKGNCSQYIYKREDAEGLDTSLAHNQNRFLDGNITYTNLYLEKILYCNKTVYKNFGDDYPSESDYFFQTIFDYGTLSGSDSAETLNTWDFREDAFSDYKAGFEIRTTRLCKRVLLFHYFDELANGSSLIKSVNFSYDTSIEKGFSFLKAISAYGYIKKEDGSYSSKSLPATEFEYQAHAWNNEVKLVSAESLTHAPSGLDEQSYQFIDLFNEGVSGILTEELNGWYYKHNLGGGNFAQAKLINPKPSFSGLNSQLQVTDLDADGTKQLVSLHSEPKGYFELNDDDEWQNFKAFQQMPNLDLNQSNARMIDLNGDGKPEILITEDNIFTWYESDGRKGFSTAHKTPKPFDEEAGPHLVFADQTQSIFLADMSGDGLIDIVRIRNSSVSYWPNLGYGKFGAKISMDNAPLFDDANSFNPTFIKLADIDGSGTSDIIYLGKNKFSCWMNLNGNSFTEEPFEITAFPEIHNLAKISVLDLLGTGLSCITWSSSLEKDSNSALRYIDLMSSKKPHIMSSFKNNLGKEVSLEYTPSSKFYLEDKLAGKPWVTKLHFPIHCVSKTETRDLISGHRFSNSYKYHHGYYDHAEAEFRGFGMVEQIDTEYFENWVKSGASNIVEAELHQEPVVSKSWFHTGAFLRKDKILTQFTDEYWYAEMAKAGFSITHYEEELEDARIIASPNIPDSVLQKLNSQEWQEALRACKGMNLRKELFAYDAPESGATEEEIKRELTPFSVSTHNSVIELLQPKGKNKHAVFMVKESEARSYNYERNIEDPRITHSLNIKLDEYANVLESASIVYPRLSPDTSLATEIQEAQNQTIISYIKNTYTNDVINDEDYRLRLSSEVQTYELKGLSKSGTYYSINDFEDILESATAVHYHEIDTEPSSGTSQKRLIEHTRTLYRSDDLINSLALNQLESLALPYENYQLAYTPELLDYIYSAKATPTELSNLMNLGKFTHSKDETASLDSNWWVPSGTNKFIEGIETTDTAQERFYVPIAYIDPYGAKTKVKYYSNYYFLIEETEDILGNKNTVDLFNFRTLSPQRMRDANNNLSESLSDELGLVKVSAVFGKGSEADNLSGHLEYNTVIEKTLINNFINANSSDLLISYGKSLLKQATSFFVYDLEVYQNTGKPTVVASITREEHYNKNNNSPIQIAFEYSNGSGQVALKKAQAEPGLAKQVIINSDNSYTVTEIDTSSSSPKQLRWLGNGKTIINNKGNDVKQYEPFFSVTHKFEDYKELIETGVTTIKYYDAGSRLIKTVLPNGTFSKTIFDSWKQSIYDPNDTVLESDWYIDRTNRFIDAELISVGKNPSREKIAADNTAKHADTPLVQHFDTLGRAILSIDHNKNIITEADEFYSTRVKRDSEGNLLTVIDTKNNSVMSFKYDMLGNKVYQKSMDAGQRWLMINIMGSPLRTWDERNHEFQYSYDVLHRPIQSKVTGGDGSSPLNHIFDRICYGENESNPELKNLRGKVIKHYDTAGLVETLEFDFKGQPLARTRKLFSKYKEITNWTDLNLSLDLETDGFTFITEADALGRISKQTAPDGSIIIPSYNEAGLLNGETVTHKDPSLTTTYIKDIDYNEKGAYSKIIYGNDVVTQFYYDKETYRLNRLETRRLSGDPLQDWYYTYDPTGNITHIEDKNIPTVFFNNAKITGVSSYIYDAIYRLVEASGRENNKPLSFGSNDNWNDNDYKMDLNYSDPLAMRNYTQTYQYDAVGNILQMRHQAASNNWTRNYSYASSNNRLLSSQVGQGSSSYNYNYSYHAQHGYMTALPHLDEMSWNFKEEIVKSIRQRRFDGGTPETTYYQYDADGKRIRKITENQADAGLSPTKKDERIYIAGYELYKKHSGSDAGLERRSLSLLEKGKRFVSIETRNDVDDGSEKHLIRYQLHNHLGSACLELDSNASVISYEEYHPFGSTAYQAKNSNIKSAAKRYRFTGMERDEETGLNYHGARYYLPWLGRWLNADPIGLGDGVNLYAYVKNHPINMSDTSGTQGDQLGFWQCSAYYTEVTATYSSRGISPELRTMHTGVYRMWTGDYTTQIQVGHMGKPFVLLRAGEVSLVGPQIRAENASQGASVERPMAAAARASGGYARTDGLDRSPTGIASRGTSYDARPYSPALASGRSTFITLGSATAAPAPTPPLISIPPSSGSPAPFSSGPAQQSFPFARGPQQLTLDFNRPAAPAMSTAAPAPVSTSPAPTQLSLDFNRPAPATPAAAPAAASPAAPAPRPAPVSPSSGGANLVGGVGRSVPFVAEAEVALVSASHAAAMSTTTAPLAAPLMTAAEALPVVAGAGAIGAGAGHAVRAGATALGADQSTADTVGLGAAVLTGAYLGTFVGGPVGTVVGAGLGAVVAGGLYLWSIN